MAGKNRIEWGKELVQLGSEIASLTAGVGVPGISLIAKFAEEFHKEYLLSRFAKFCEEAEIDGEFVKKVLDSETYSNCFYSVLETVRKTHCRWGLTVIALIYRDHWDNAAVLLPAVRSFSEISDNTIMSFVELYEGIPEDRNFIELTEEADGEKVFHHLYAAAVELIHREIFVESRNSAMAANGPIQGMKWDHTDLYFKYCVEAKKYV